MPEPQGPKKVTIFINDEQFQTEQLLMTGLQLKAMAGINPLNRIFLEGPGSHPDQPVSDSEPLQLNSGMKFFDLPPGVVGCRA